MRDATKRSKEADRELARPGGTAVRAFASE